MSEQGLSPLVAALADERWLREGHLALRGLGLRALPAVPDLTALIAGARSLDLGGNRLTKLPSWIWDLTLLESLVLSGNRLRVLDAGVSRLAHLRELDVSNNRLATLPPELAQCRELRRLDLSGNALSDIGVLARLPALVALDIADNRIEVVAQAPSPATLQVLDLSANRLADLPAELSSLRALRRLDLSNNELTDVDLAGLADAPLEELYLDDNHIAQFSHVSDLTMLKRMSALGNLTDFDVSASAAVPVSGGVAEMLDRYVTGQADPHRQYFDAPTLRLDASLSLQNPADAQRFVDLYYKSTPGMPADVSFADGSRMSLSSMSRGSALDFVGVHCVTGTQAFVHLAPTKNAGIVQAGTGFFARAIARLDSAVIVPERDPQGAVAFRQPAVTPLSRVLNVAVTDAHEQVVGPTAGLVAESDYAVRIDVGPVVSDSIVINPMAIRDEDLQASSVEGFWFDVLVTSSDVDVATEIHRLFLPFAGRSWTCPCQGEQHTCAGPDRRPFLHVVFRTRERPGRAALRCTLYNANNVIQSARVDFDVVDSAGRPGLIRGEIDFALTDDAARADLLAPRDLNVLTNESADATHMIVVNNGQRAIAVDITDSLAQKVLGAIRGKLQAITLGPDGKKSQYDDENRKPTDAFIKDLKELARLGSQLWASVVNERRDRIFLREQLAGRATIQITRVTPTIFPWALIYDIPRELTAKWKLCPLLQDWGTNQAQLAAYPDRCPYHDQHAANVLCPYGFWGFRHLIEQPPSPRRGVLPTSIQVTGPAHAAIGRSTTLNADLAQAHLADLGDCLAGRFDLVPCVTCTELRQAFADPALPLVYFYCHGRRAQLGDTDLEVPALEIGVDELIGASDFAVWDESDAWGPGHWADTAPLVFINGCETARLEPGDIVSFVEALAGMDAAGVIGTEIPVAQRVAGEMALRFYAQFAGQDAVSAGLSLYRTRIDLLRLGNVAGLVYTPFCSMDLALHRATA